MNFKKIYESKEEEADYYEVTVTCKYKGKVQRFSWTETTKEGALTLCERKKSEFLDDLSEESLLKIEFNKVCKPVIYYEA